MYFSNSISPLWHTMPSSVCMLRFNGKILSKTLTLCTLWLKKRPVLSLYNSFNFRSPACPNGVCPISWPREIASIKSVFNPSSPPIFLAILDTNCTWLERLEISSFLYKENTWVLSAYRLYIGKCIIFSQSRTKEGRKSLFLSLFIFLRSTSSLRNA